MARGTPARPVVRVWRKDGAIWRLTSGGLIRTWENLSCEPSHNSVGPWSMSLALDSPEVLQLLNKRRLVTIDLPEVEGQTRTRTRFTGRIQRVAPKFDSSRQRPLLEVGGTDALSFLGGVVCYPQPELGLNAQTETHYVDSGPAETVLRTLARENVVTRRGEAVVFPASEGRGSDIEVEERFSSLLQVMARKARAGGLGVRMGLRLITSVTADLQVTFYVPEDRARAVLEPRQPDGSGVGTVRSWEQADEAPEMTRAIVLGPGKGINRKCRAVRDQAAEDEWGWSEEAVVDARGTKVSSSLTGQAATDRMNEKLDSKGSEALADAGEQNSFTLDALETKGVRLGVNFWLGDRLPVRPMPGVDSRMERLNRVVVESTPQAPLTIKLVPGNPAGGDPMFRQAALVRDIRKRVRNLEQEEE